MLVRATTTFHAPGPVTVLDGDLLDDTDELVKKFPQFFEVPRSSADVRAEQFAASRGEVVDTTARPGARRGSKG
jgi:hypothetical protein